MRQWTEEECNRQASLIRNWQPWKKAAPKTEKAKAASRKNALKHGMYSAEVKAWRQTLSECRRLLKTLTEK